MESLRRAGSNLSISSIISDSIQRGDNSETATKSLLKILQEATAESSAENSALSTDILEMLGALKLDPKTLPSDIRDGLQVVSAILKSEGLAHMDERKLELCMEKKKMESKKKEREEKLLKSKYNTAFAKYNVLEEKLKQVRNQIEDVQDDIVQAKLSNGEIEESNRILWSTRLQDYKETVKNLEEEMESLQLKDIDLQQTQNKSMILMEKMNTLAELNKELAQYNELPPNLLQAKKTLERKQRELEGVENLLHEKMSL